MKKVILRVSESLFTKMDTELYQNYPRNEWGFFLKTNWSEVDGCLFVTLVDFIPYNKEDISYGKGLIKFHEPYLIKAISSLGKEDSGIAVIHSHPLAVPPFPSLMDDDMDSYLSAYFKDFSTSSPYLSLIFTKSADGLTQFTGRGVMNGAAFRVDELRIVGKRIKKIYAKGRERVSVPDIIQKRLERLCDSYGPLAAQKLWNSEATIVGSGGTGSPAAHSLARSGVGTINLIDFDILNLHNSERVHGSFAKHFEDGVSTYKVEAVKELLHLINPLIKVNIYKGSLLDPQAKSMILRSDIVLGCTDTEHAKVALSEFVWRFFAVGLLVNVSIESGKGRVNGQIIHLTHLYPSGPCVYCMSLVNNQRLAQELMPKAEVEARKKAVQEAIKTGQEGNAYWLEEPVIPTVGALATIGGESISNYYVGLITETFEPVNVFSEINLLSEHPSVHLNLKKNEKCLCRTAYGKSDQIGSKGVIIK